MNRQWLTRRVAASVVVVFVLGAAAGSGVKSSAAAPFGPPASNAQKEETVSFKKALETLSQRYNVGFVAEDEPFNDAIPASLLAEIRQNTNLSADEAVQKVAQAFDYSAARWGTTFLLQKRFTHVPSEIPSVTLEECVLAVRDTERTVGPLNPNVPPFNGREDPLSDHFMRSLTQDQLSAMFNGLTNVTTTEMGKPIRGVTMAGVPTEGFKQKSSKGTIEIGLPVRSLSPEQRADVSRIAAYYFIQYPLDRMEEAFVKLEALSNPNAVFRFETVQVPNGPAVRVLGCVVPASKPGGKSEWHDLFSDYDPKIGMTQVPSGYYEAFTQRYEVVGPHDAGIPVPEKSADLRDIIARYQAKTQTSDDAGRKGIQEAQKRRAVSTSETLAQVAKRLNARTGSLKPSLPQSPPVAVDPALASKRVTLVGVDIFLSLPLWTNVARTYDLAVREMPDGSLYMTRPRPKAARVFADVPEAMQRVLPRPLRSLVSYGQKDTLQHEAENRFRIIANQTASASPTGEFTLKDLGEEGQQYLGLMLVGFWPVKEMIQLAEPVPDYVVNFDNRVILGGLVLNLKNETIFSFFLGREIRPGTFAQGVGFGAVHYKH